jgi:Spy/CpxP family protein refolding chaperone
MNFTPAPAKRLIAAFLLAAALTVGAWSLARAGQANDQGQRARLRERIGELYLLRLTRALDLTEEQAAQVYPLLTRAEKEKAEIQRGMGQDLRALREELAKTPPEDKALLSLVDRIREARRAIRKSDEKVEAELDRVLTPVQRARYLVFSVEFLRNVGENLGRARAGRPPLKRSP